MVICVPPSEIVNAPPMVQSTTMKVVADSNADATGNIPFPTVLVLDADRRITFADIHVDYTTRTEVPAIIAALG